MFGSFFIGLYNELQTSFQEYDHFYYMYSVFLYRNIHTCRTAYG